MTALRPKVRSAVGRSHLGLLAVLTLIPAVCLGQAAGVGYNKADVDFMQGMIMHHAQAVVMSQLAVSRSSRDDLETLAKRIDISQRDEIKMMEQWLKDRNQNVPTAMLDTTDIGKPMGGMKLMPGMLTDDQMRQLSASKGATFDSLFLNGMIRHHQGALQMVAELRETPGATQDPATFAFASDVDAVQRAEIRAMSAMLRK